MKITHIMGHYELMSHPSKLEMREDEGTIYLRHGSTTATLTLTEDQANELMGLLSIIKNRGGFRQMEEA
jgi:hypothetical protein